MANTLRIKRRASGATGAPESLQNAELAFNEVDNTLYYGKGNSGANGTATTVIPIGGDGSFVSLTSNQTVSGTKTFTSTVQGSVSGNAGTATKLTTPRTIAVSGDATGSTSFDGSANATISTTLATVNTNVGTFGSTTQIPSITVNGKGLITGVTTNTISTSFTIAGGSGTDVVNTGETLTFTGNAPISTAVTNNTVAISAADATTTTKGVASFNAGNFSVTSGAVDLSNAGTAGTYTKVTTDAKGRVTSGTTLAATDIPNLDASKITTGTFAAARIPNLDTAKITTGTFAAARMPAYTGDASSTAGTTSLTLASVGTAGTYTKVTTDAKGRVTSGTTLTATDIPTLTADKISNFDTQVRTSRLDQMAAPTAAVSLNGQKLTNLAAPTQDTDAANKAYVDASRLGLDIKESVKVATTANITLSGLQNIDGITVVAGDRVLVKNQTTASDNGVYLANAAAWTRASDFVNGFVSSGAFMFVEQGTSQADSGWTLTTDGAITVGTTNLSFAQFSGAGQLVAGAGLVKSGNVVDVVGSTGRIVVNADNIDLATTGTAGTYRSVTTDAFGRVTAGTNPTTLAGYGITDAQPLNAKLTSISGLTLAANQLIYATGATTFAASSLTAFGRSLLDDADAATARTTLGLGTISTQNANNVNITGGTIDNVTFDMGTF